MCVHLLRLAHARARATLVLAGTHAAAPYVPAGTFAAHSRVRAQAYRRRLRALRARPAAACANTAASARYLWVARRTPHIACI
jgi:hypothetical protein